MASEKKGVRSRSMQSSRWLMLPNSARPRSVGAFTDQRCPLARRKARPPQSSAAQKETLQRVAIKVEVSGPPVASVTRELTSYGHRTQLHQQNAPITLPQTSVGDYARHSVAWVSFTRPAAGRTTLMVFLTQTRLRSRTHRQMERVHRGTKDRIITDGRPDESHQVKSESY